MDGYTKRRFVDNCYDKDDQTFYQQGFGGEEYSDIPSSTEEDHAHGDPRTAGTLGEDRQDHNVKLSAKDESRLLGAFLLAAEGGLDGGRSLQAGGGDTERKEQPHLSTDAPSCLKKFTTIAASLGLKTTREQLREDFEKVVTSNGLVRNPPGDPWRGACDPDRPVVGFTYKVFRRYYLDKIQGQLLEVNIRQAWNDLHHGTGGKVMRSGARPSADFDPPEGPSAATTERRVREGRRQQQQDGHDGDCGGRPYVTRAELQKILTTDGEALTDEEVDELLRECRPDEEGRIVYEGYRRMLIDPSL